MSRVKLSLAGVWLIASVSALIVPIFLPSYRGVGLFEGNPMAVATSTMFILSFPSSVIAVPALFMLDGLIGLTTSSIGLAYMNLLTLFMVGLLQWFWIVPRLLSNRKFVQELDLSEAAGNTRLFARDLTVWVDAEGATPLERVLVESQRPGPSNPEADPQSPPARDEDFPP